MYGLVLKKLKSGYFTNLKEIFDTLDGMQQEYNWLITDYDCNIYPSDKISINESFAWFSGDDLTNIVKEYDIQFIWCVLTAYRKDVPLDEILQHKLPHAIDNEALWDSNVNIQNPLAEIEIISWDSSLLRIVSKSKDILENFIKEYPDAIDLTDFASLNEF